MARSGWRRRGSRRQRAGLAAAYLNLAGWRVRGGAACPMRALSWSVAGAGGLMPGIWAGVLAGRGQGQPAEEMLPAGGVDGCLVGGEAAVDQAQAGAGGG